MGTKDSEELTASMFRVVKKNLKFASPFIMYAVKKSYVYTLYNTTQQNTRFFKSIFYF